MVDFFQLCSQKYFFETEKIFFWRSFLFHSKYMPWACFTFDMSSQLQKLTKLEPIMWKNHVFNFSPKVFIFSNYEETFHHTMSLQRFYLHIQICRFTAALLQKLTNCSKNAPESKNGHGQTTKMNFRAILSQNLNLIFYIDEMRKKENGKKEIN